MQNLKAETKMQCALSHNFTKRDKSSTTISFDISQQRITAP